jgi:hypothetical protein
MEFISHTKFNIFKQLLQLLRYFLSISIYLKLYKTSVKLMVQYDNETWTLETEKREELQWHK